LKVEPAFELLEMIEILDRVGRADFEKDERIVVRSLAKLAQPHAIGSIRNHSHVLNDLIPTSELLVFADPKAEELLRRGDVGSR